MKRGAVLLEYVLLLGTMVPGAMLVSYSIVAPDGELGPLGNELCGFFHRCVSVVCVPYP